MGQESALPPTNSFILYLSVSPPCCYSVLLHPFYLPPPKRCLKVSEMIGNRWKETKIATEGFIMQSLWYVHCNTWTSRNNREDFFVFFCHQSMCLENKTSDIYVVHPLKHVLSLQILYRPGKGPTESGVISNKHMICILPCFSHTLHYIIMTTDFKLCLAFQLNKDLRGLW